MFLLDPNREVGVEQEAKNDREQVRRDAERERDKAQDRWGQAERERDEALEGRKDDLFRQREASEDARLKAERERDELGPLFIRDCCRILGVDENDYLRMDKIGTRLASVPALVEHVTTAAYCGAEETVTVEQVQQILRDALTVYEQSQGNG